jgi:hypothetical protein
MKFFIVLFAVIAAALAAPQFGFGGGLSGSAANAGASSQTFNAGGPFGGGFSGSAANAQASSQSFNQVRNCSDLCSLVLTEFFVLLTGRRFRWISIWSRWIRRPPWRIWRKPIRWIPRLNLDNHPTILP